MPRGVGTSAVAKHTLIEDSVDLAELDRPRCPCTPSADELIDEHGLAGGATHATGAAKRAAAAAARAAAHAAEKTRGRLTGPRLAQVALVLDVQQPRPPAKLEHEVSASAADGQRRRLSN